MFQLLLVLAKQQNLRIYSENPKNVSLTLWTNGISNSVRLAKKHVCTVVVSDLKTNFEISPQWNLTRKFDPEILRQNKYGQW